METNSIIKHASGSRFLKINQDYYEVLDRDADATIILGILEGWLNFKVSEMRKYTDKCNTLDLLVYRTYTQLMEDSMGLLGSKNRIAKAIAKLEAKGFIVIRRNPKKGFEFDRRNFYEIQLSKINSLLQTLDLKITEEPQGRTIDLTFFDVPVQDDGERVEDHVSSKQDEVVPIENFGSCLQEDNSPIQDLKKNKLIDLKKDLEKRKTTNNQPKQETQSSLAGLVGGSFNSLSSLKPSSDNTLESAVSIDIEMKNQEQEQNQEQNLLTYAKSLFSDLDEQSFLPVIQKIASWKESYETKELALAFCLYTGHIHIKQADMDEKWIRPLHTLSFHTRAISEDIKVASEKAKSEQSKKHDCSWNEILTTPMSYQYRISSEAMKRQHVKKRKLDIYDVDIDWKKKVTPAQEAEQQATNPTKLLEQTEDREEKLRQSNRRKFIRYIESLLESKGTTLQKSTPNYADTLLEGMKNILHHCQGFHVNDFETVVDPKSWTLP